MIKRCGFEKLDNLLIIALVNDHYGNTTKATESYKHFP